MKSRVVMFGCAGAVVVVVVTLAWLAWSFGAFERPPQIARDLTSYTDFEARAEQAFPIGTPARQLKETLEAQGFEHGWTYDTASADPRDLLIEAMTWRGRGCSEYQVAFKADRDGQLVWVRGSVPNMCY